MTRFLLGKASQKRQKVATGNSTPPQGPRRNVKSSGVLIVTTLQWRHSNSLYFPLRVHLNGPVSLSAAALCSPLQLRSFIYCLVFPICFQYGMANHHWLSVVVLSLVLQCLVEINGRSMVVSRELPDLLPPWLRRYFSASQAGQVTNYLRKSPYIPSSNLWIPDYFKNRHLSERFFG